MNPFPERNGFRHSARFPRCLIGVNCLIQTTNRSNPAFCKLNRHSGLRVEIHSHPLEQVDCSWPVTARAPNLLLRGSPKNTHLAIEATKLGRIPHRAAHAKCPPDLACGGGGIAIGLGMVPQAWTEGFRRHPDQRAEKQRPPGG